MTRRLVAGYVGFALALLLVLEIPLGLLAARLERHSLMAGIRVDATALALTSQGLLAQAQAPRLRTLVTDYARYSGRGRAVVVAADGRVLADSAPLEPGMPDYGSRPEIQVALSGQTFAGFRFSQTLGTELLIVAVPLTVDGATAGAVRLTYPADVVNSRVRRTWLALGTLGAIVLVLAVGLGYLLARGMTRPVRELHETAGRLAAGDTAARTPVPPGPPELRLLASQFNAMADRVTELLQAQRAFLADVSHQLRTPLAALRLRLDVLAGRSSGQARQEVEQAGAEAARLGRLVEGLLAVARNEAQDAPLEVVDAAAVARERAQAWSALAEEEGMHLRADTADDVPVRVVPGALEQVLDNLLANAITASRSGDTVHVRVEPTADGVRVVVDDEGRGLTDDQLATLAAGQSPPSTAPRRADVAGSGLGLTIVRRLVKASGGSFTVVRNAGTGTRAQVTLPRA